MKTTKTLPVAGIRGGCVGPRILPFTKEPRGQASGEHDVPPPSRDRLKTWVVGIVLVAVLAGNAAAQVTRQESTNQLRKVVYSGDPAQCPQLVLRVYTNPDGSYGDYHYAIVSIPELTLTNMPVVSTFVYSVLRSGAPEGWMQSESYLSEGECRVGFWKYTGIDSRGFFSFLYFTAFRIVMTYETGSNLSVTNTGTGKSLELSLRPDPQTDQKVRGYKVYRREMEERK